jgi:hypothetical protein
MDRPITPPPELSCPLTPPPTGGFDKRDSFDDIKVTSSNPRRVAIIKEGESLTEFFEAETISSISGTTPTSPVSDASDPRTNIPNEHDLFGLLAIFSKAPAVTEPFPLLKLPISVRNKVYEHLLVVPGIVCVRQKYTTSNGSKFDELHPEDRVLVPGISRAFAQLTVNGPIILFCRFASTNINILLTSKEVLAETRAVLYSKNAFEIVRPSTELTPPCDFSVRLFPPGCQRLVTKLNICIRSFYDLHWLLRGGYNDVKNFYRSLNTLTLILKLDSITKGFARQWAKSEREKWDVYVKRLQIEVVKDAFATSKSAAGKAKKVKAIPTWINLRVLFGGESYNTKLSGPVGAMGEQAKRDELRHALVEAWESLKKGGR